jgi:hypothetical protein
MSPLQVLRNFFERDDVLRPMSTQSGFANLIGRSEPLIRSVEKGRLEMSPKLAKRISFATGVSEGWLAGEADPAEPIPCRDGTTLTVEKLKDAIMEFGFMPKFLSDPPSPAVESVVNRVMIDSVMTMIRAELVDYARQPNPQTTDPTVELLEWLRKRASDRSPSFLK